MVTITTNPVHWTAVDGIYINPVPAPEPVSIGISGVIGMCGEMPWGPVDTPIRISSATKLIKTFVGPASDPSPYFMGVWREFFAKIWNVLGIYITRVSPTGQLTAAHAVDDGAAGTAFSIEAKYPGAAGNGIEYKITNVADPTFDLTVRWGDYEETYEGVTLLTMRDAIADSLLITIPTGTDVLPVVMVAYQALLLGNDGMAASADYYPVAGMDGFKGLLAIQDIELFVAGTHDETVGASMDTELQSRGYGMFIDSDAGDATPTEMNAAADTYNSSRVLLCYPSAKVKYTGSADGWLTQLTNFFAASVLGAQSPHVDLAAYRSKKYLGPVKALDDDADIGKADYVTFAAHGVAALEAQPKGGYRFKSGVMTDGSLVVVRRMQDLIYRDTSDRLGVYQNEPLDTDLKRGVKATLEAYFKNLVKKGMIHGAVIDLEALNDDDTEAVGELHIVMKVRLIAPARYIVIHAQVGTTVVLTVEEAA